MQIYLQCLVDDKHDQQQVMQLNRLERDIGRQDNWTRAEKPVGFPHSNVGTDYESLYAELLSGNCVNLVDGYEKYISASQIPRKGLVHRRADVPNQHQGPEGCFRKIRRNLMLVRKRIKTRRSGRDHAWDRLENTVRSVYHRLPETTWSPKSNRGL
jgi:spore germination protein KA